MAQNTHFLGGIKERLDYIYNNYTRKDKEIARALDIGAGKGSSSLYLAKYGFLIDAVDIWNREEFQREEKNDHPNITKHNCKIEDFIFHHSYNVIVITNVIMFLDRSYVLDILLPSFDTYLCDGGIICIAYLESNNKDTKRKLTHQHWFQKEEILGVMNTYTLLSEETTNVVEKNTPKTLTCGVLLKNNDF